MIEVKNLNKSFGERQVLHDINVRFEDEKTNLVIGQSGLGKTVLVKGIIGLLSPSSEQVLYDDRDFVAMRKQEQMMIRQKIGMAFQNSALFDSLSVLKNVTSPLDTSSTKSYRERVKRIQKCLECVSLLDVQDKAPGELSGSMQKRVATTRAIVLDPRYLSCGGPSSGPDSEASSVMDQLLSGITKEFGIATIINTYDVNSVMEIGEHITFIRQDHVEWTGNRDNVANPDNKKLNDLVSASDLFKRVKQAENEE